MTSLELSVHIESGKLGDYPSVIRGKGDFENLHRDILREIAKQEKEHVYILTRFIDGTFKFEKIASGESGEVRFDSSTLRPTQGVAQYTLYHNHPSGDMVTISPPSSDDFATATILSGDVIHKIIVEQGIWQFRVTNITQAKNIANKLGTLLNYLVGNKDDMQLIERMKVLNTMGVHYGQVAYSYKGLLENNAKSEMFIGIFKSSMQKFGFYVDFEPFMR